MTTKNAAVDMVFAPGDKVCKAYTRGAPSAMVYTVVSVETIFDWKAAKHVARVNVQCPSGKLYARSQESLVCAVTKSAVDMALATEFQLCLENESALYPQRQAIEKNLSKRMASGKYDAVKAPKLWLYWVTEGARWYAKEHGAKIGKAEREYVANELAQAFEAECEIQRNARSLPRADPEFMPSTYYDG